MNRSTHILGIHGCPRLYEHLDHVVVLPPGAEVEHRVLHGLLGVLDLRLRVVGQQLAAHVQVAGVDGSKQGDVVVLKFGNVLLAGTFHKT